MAIAVRVTAFRRVLATGLSVAWCTAAFAAPVAGQVALQGRLPHAARAPETATAALPTSEAGARPEAGPPDSVEFTTPFPVAVRAGERTPLQVTVKDAQGNRIAGQTVRVETLSSSYRLRGSSALTSETGIASFEELAVYGPRGDLRLFVIASGARSDTISVAVLEGDPARVLIVTQPSHRIIADSLLQRPPRVRVEDAAGNPLGNQEVEVGLCVGDPESYTCFELQGDLRGSRLRRSIEDGTATFDSLSVSGPGGTYYLTFALTQCPDTPESEGTCWVASQPMSYDPDWSLNRSFVTIGAIKSIAGVTPDNEFFDLRFRFRLTSRLVSLTNVDLALTARTSTDSVRSTQKRLTEATALIAVGFAPRKDPITEAPERQLLGGVVAKVVNTIPYAGLWMGAEELTGSAFQGSASGVGLVSSLYRTPFEVDGEIVRPQAFNVLAEFYIRSSDVPFFKFLNIRGTILLPIARGIPLTSRIAVLVPVDGLFTF